MNIIFVESPERFNALISERGWNETINKNFKFLFQNYMAERGHIYFAVIEDDELLGAIALQPFHDSNMGKELWLKYVDVNNSFKQKGIATLLVRKAFEYAQKHNLAIRGSSRTKEGGLAMPKIIDRIQKEFPTVKYISKEETLRSMQSFVFDKLHRVSKNDPILERFIQMENDIGKTIRVAENPGPLELASLVDEGRGLRMLIGADEFSNVILVWAGTGSSRTTAEREDIGAIHDTIGDQYGMPLHGNRHVPMEMSPQGRLKVTVTVQETSLEDQRDIEDVLDRNRKFQRMFGGKEISYAALRSLF